MGGELVTAEASWLEVVKSAANVEQYEEDRVFSATVSTAWIDQLNDLNAEVQNVESGSSNLLKPLTLNSEAITPATESEEQLLVKELKKILQQSDYLSKQSFLGLLGSRLSRLTVKQDDSTPSKSKAPRRRRNGLLDGVDEDSTLKLLRDTCRQFGHRLISLILECAVALSFWAVVQILLQRRVVVSNSFPNLVQSLAEEEKPLLLCLYTANVPDLTPQDVYTMLTFFLDSIASSSKSFGPVKSEWRRVATEEIAKAAKSRDATQVATSNSMFYNVENLSRGHDNSVSSAIALAVAIDGFSSPELCIHHLLASGPDEAVLSSVVSQLSTGQVLQLTRYLGKWIERYSSHLENFPTPRSGRVPSFAQVLSWVGVVLEGHLTQFVLSSDFHKELKSMRDMVQPLVDFGADISPLGGITEHIKSQSLLPTGKQQGGGGSDYVIELLDMS
ncbi:unnamed protein product [Calypogeia fissa]